MMGLSRLIMGSRPFHHACEPPSSDTVSSTVMIVTLSLPFQLDAQFHPCVPRESQPHHPRLESPNRSPPSSYMQLDPALSLHSAQCDKGERARAENNEHIQAARQHTHTVHTQKCLD